MFKNYSRVRLLVDRPEDNLSIGAIGFIIEVYDGEYEVEFSDENGITIAQIVAQHHELELFP